MLHVEVVLHEIAREPIEQLRAPRLPVHLIRVADDSVAEKARPDAVDQRPREPSEARVGEDRRCRGATISQRVRRGDAGKFGEEEPGLRVAFLRDIAAIELQLRLGREVGRQRVGVLQLPLAHEAVVAGVALQIHAKEDLRGVLRRLHPWLHGRARLSTPVHSDQKALGIGGLDGIEQLRDELVVRQVCLERRVAATA